MKDKKTHWEEVFSTKNANQVSWTQNYPKITIQFIEEINLPKNASIIDVGGGESFLAEVLLEKGFTNITVLEISQKAIEKAKLRMGENANKIKWIIDDVTKFQSVQRYDFWNDRAVFHFFTTEKDRTLYKQKLEQHLTQNGYFLVGTFSTTGPFKCSALGIIQYDEHKLEVEFLPNFELFTSYEETHTTPMQTSQNFQFGGFKKQINLKK